MNKLLLQTALADARSDLLRVLRSLPPARIERPATLGDWSVKETAAHIAAWESWRLTAAQKVLWGDGRLVHWLHSEQERDEWNQRQMRLARGWSWPEALRTLALQREETDWNVDCLREEQLAIGHQAGAHTITVGDLLFGIATHDRQHLAILQRWLATAPPTAG